MALCAAAPFAGCGRNQTAPLSEGGENSPASAGAEPAELPLDQQTEQKLDPLTQDDIELYLKVMRAAADRVKNPTPDDKAALGRREENPRGRRRGPRSPLPTA